MHRYKVQNRIRCFMVKGPGDSEAEIVFLFNPWMKPVEITGELMRKCWDEADGSFSLRFISYRDANGVVFFKQRHIAREHITKEVPVLVDLKMNRYRTAEYVDGYGVPPANEWMNKLKGGR